MLILIILKRNMKISQHFGFSDHFFQFLGITIIALILTYVMRICSATYMPMWIIPSHFLDLVLWQYYSTASTHFDPFVVSLLSFFFFSFFFVSFFCLFVCLLKSWSQQRRVMVNCRSFFLTVRHWFFVVVFCIWKQVLCQRLLIV